MEDLEAECRALEEKIHRRQVQEENRLQLVIEDYESDREADQQKINKKKQEIKEKELALNKLKEALQADIQTAAQREATRKRKHDAEVQSLNQNIEKFKRFKRNSMELFVRPASFQVLVGKSPALDSAPLVFSIHIFPLSPTPLFDIMNPLPGTLNVDLNSDDSADSCACSQSETPQPSAPSALALNSRQPSLETSTSKFHGTSQAQPGTTRMSTLAYTSKEDLAPDASPSVQRFPDSSFYGSTVISRSGLLNTAKQQDYAPSSRQDSAILKAIEGQRIAARAEATEDDAIEPNPDNHSGSDDPYNSSYEDSQSDGDFSAGNRKLKGSGNLSSYQAQSPPPALTKKTIAYDEVYEIARDPHAEYKHWIFEYPQNCGNWYIIRCLEHNLNWGKNPLRPAATHLQVHGPSHTYNTAVAKLGELVEGCDRQKADLSNAQYQKALDQGYTPNNHTTKTRQEVQAKPAQNPGHELPEGVIDPVVGQIYHAWWDSNESWFSVVVLPYLGDGNWKEVGITGNLFSSSALKNDIPKCFKKAKVTTESGEDVLKLMWADGYQDDGRKVNSRQFPCLFLHPPLRIPSADQEFILDNNTERVLAFRAVHQLRHPSTNLPQGTDMMGVLAYKDLTRDFEARLRAVKGKQNLTPEQEAEDQVNGQASLLLDQQHPKPMASIESTESRHLSTCPGVAQHNSTKSNISTSGDRSRDNPDPRTLVAQSARVSSPNHLSNSLISKRDSHVLTMEGHGSIQGMADLSNGRRAKLSNITGPFPGSRGRSNESGITSQPFDRSRQGTGVRSGEPQGLRAAEAADFSSPEAFRRAGEGRGPTALRTLDLKGNASHIEEGLQQDNISRRRHSADTVERNAVPNGAGKTARPSSHSATLR